MRNLIKKVAILCGPGTNCHAETARALRLVGLDSAIVQISEILNGQVRLNDYWALVIPGGFSWGDHFGSGRIFALFLRRFQDDLRQMVEGDSPILGICNGFQVLTETGLLPDLTIGEPKVALVTNALARFESRSVDLWVPETKSFWTKGLGGSVLRRLPVAHGEGNPFIPTGTDILPGVFYAKDGKPTTEYPFCPNGSPGGIAGLIDSKKKLVFGLMPHPERACRQGVHPSSDGLKIFQNLADYLNSRPL
ncbi:MAG: phosphoribosylformylglycinamidine synthase subunit PurQ [bacterium]|nr:phosphoribosylformylglycinamidine synthase subunit PurQ [bacterium]